jgi:hypothetical protein
VLTLDGVDRLKTVKHDCSVDRDADPGAPRAMDKQGSARSCCARSFPSNRNRKSASPTGYRRSDRLLQFRSAAALCAFAVIADRPDFTADQALHHASGDRGRIRIRLHAFMLFVITILSS